MDFESALAHYRAHTATAEETALVERELKKFRLIEDCLAAQELPELPEELAEAAQAETKAVKRRMNRRAGWTILAAVAAVLAVLALLQFVISPLVNRTVYNDRWQGADYDEAAYRDFDVGMSVLAGLYMPLGDYYGSWSQHTGFMSDTISLNFYDYTGSNRFGINSQLTLRLGKLSQLNSSDLHALGYAYSGFFSSDPSDDNSRTALTELPDYLSVTSAVSFDRELDTEELTELMARHPELEFLSAKVTVDGAYFTDGLYCSLRRMSRGYGPLLDEAYPDIQLVTNTAQNIQQHFESMLQYLIDHPRLAKTAEMMNPSYRYKEMLSSVQRDGLKTEGVWVQGTPSSILALLEEDCVAGTYNYAADTVLWKE